MSSVGPAEVATAPAAADPTDDLLPLSVRSIVEERWWRPVEAGAALETLRQDDQFMADPTEHPALFGDHGVVHVRDIARGVESLAATTDGLLLPRRPPDRQRFLVATALLATYLHDIGMADPSPVGRRVHALVAAQAPFTSEADDLISLLLAQRGAIVRRLEEVDADVPFGQPLDVVLRELWSLNMAHSKSTVPIAVLNDPAALRVLMQRCVFTSLDDHRRSDRTPPADQPGPPAFDVHTQHYRDPRTSYGWLTAPAPSHRALVHDVIDALRVLRAADALRQRGTTLRTAAGYEVFVDVRTGQAVYALRESGNTALHLLRVDRTYPAGEANIRVAIVTTEGHLRVAFNRGAFDTTTAQDHAIEGSAEVLVDIALDVLPSFDTVAPGDLPPPRARSGSMQVFVERPSDGGRFADDVVARVRELRPELADRVRAVAGVEDAETGERDRYHRAEPVLAGTPSAVRIIAGVASRGVKVTAIDPETAFVDVRIARVTAGEEVAAAGSPPMFVYLPTDDGLEINPDGGYLAEAAPSWLPIGVTGAVRRAERNSSVVARTDLDVVMIPAEVFVREWFRPHAAGELADALARGDGA